MGLKKLIMGEPMPDKNDPRYKERYEKEKEAGRKFAEKTGVTWMAARLQRWGQNHSLAFLAIVFGVVLFCLGLNVYRLIAYSLEKREPTTATELVDKALREKHLVNEKSDSNSN